MSDVLTCLEHQAIPIVASRANGELALTRSEAALLERRAHLLPPKAFAWGRDSVKWGHYCGVIQLGKTTLEILPKIYGCEEEPGSCRQALIQMLKKARLLKNHRGTSANVRLQKLALLDIFILQFCEELQELLTQGLLRQYVEKEESLGVLKGRLLIDMQLKHNLVHKERLYCRYDELDEDTRINRLLKFTLKLFYPKAHAFEVRRTINELLFRFDSIPDQVFKAEDLDDICFDRLTARFEDIVGQCAMFIRGLSPDVFAGTGQALSMLFDMNALFERWVAAQLRPLVWREGLRLREQGPRKFLAASQDYGREVFQMKPDISFLDDANRVVLLADAKWKLLNDVEAKLGILQADLYQMAAYANRYQTASLVLLYPKQSGFTKEVELTLLGSHTANIRVVPVDITSASLGIDPITHI